MDLEAIRAAVKRLNDLEPEIQRLVQRLSGSSGWKSFNAAVKYGPRDQSFASLFLSANVKDGNLVKMDRLEIRLYPIKQDARGWVYNLNLNVSRMVRDLRYGQDADVSEKQNISAGNVAFDDIDAKSLVMPSKSFWMKVADLKPRKMENSVIRLRKLAGIESSRAGLAENTVSDTIIQQMGGVGRIKTMLGSKAVLQIPDGIAFKWPSKKRSRGNYVEVRLDSSDTYTMEFFDVSGSTKKPVQRYDNLFADQLVDVFEKQTGLALSLGSAGKRTESVINSKLNELRSLLGELP